MKKILCLLFVAFSINNYAQVENKFRVGLDVGYFFAEKTDLGVSFALEPKYNIKKNMNVGFRIEGVAGYRYLITYNGKTSGILYNNSSYTGTFDYYFDKSNTNFVMFVGGGVGINTFENKFVTDIKDTEQTKPINPKSGLGFLLRSGFEWAKFRAGIDYNIVPSSKILGRVNPVSSISSSSSEIIEGESFSNSYLSIHVGFYIGGGKWKN